MDLSLHFPICLQGVVLSTVANLLSFRFKTYKKADKPVYAYQRDTRENFWHAAFTATQSSFYPTKLAVLRIISALLLYVRFQTQQQTGMNRISLSLSPPPSNGGLEELP
jgi:hypothetical protein